MAEEGTIITTERDFWSSEGKIVTIEGKLYLETITYYLLCDGFSKSVLLKGFAFRENQVNERIRLTGKVWINREELSKEEWEKKYKYKGKGLPFHHSGYMPYQLVLENYQPSSAHGSP